MNNLQLAQNATQQILNPVPVNTGLLHLKPVSHQFHRGINFVGTILQQSNPQEINGRFKILLGKGIMAVGYTLNTAVALIESLAALTFVLLANALHFSTKAHSVHFQKLTLKINAYFINTLMVAAIQILCLKKGFFSNSHTLNSLSNHGMHGGSAILSQLPGYLYDHLARRSAQPDHLSPAVERVIRVFIELVPTAIQDLVHGAGRDFAIRNNQAHPNLQQFLRENPDNARLISQLDFNRLRTDAVYRQQLLQFVANFSTRTGILNQAAARLPLAQNANGPQPVTAPAPVNVFGVSQNQDDKKYQDDLQNLIKRSFIELHDSEDLVRMLSKENTIEDGRLELTTFSTTIQLANYVQLQEIKGEIFCPTSFNAHELQEYNNRHQRLSNAKTQFEQLNDNEKTLLTQKLLKTGDFDLATQGLTEDRAQFIQQLFRDIGTLSGQLHQGKLLAQRYVDIGQINQGNFNGAFGANNLFNGACQLASKEIEDRANVPQQPVA